MNKNKQQLKEQKAAKLIEEQRIQQQIEPQLAVANVKFHELMPKLDALLAEHGFNQFLISVGFEPVISGKPVAFMSFAAHSFGVYADNLSTMLESAVMCVDQDLHNTADDLVTTPTFTPPTANA